MNQRKQAAIGVALGQAFQFGLEPIQPGQKSLGAGVTQDRMGLALQVKPIGLVTDFKPSRSGIKRHGLGFGNLPERPVFDDHAVELIHKGASKNVGVVRVDKDFLACTHHKFELLARAKHVPLAGQQSAIGIAQRAWQRAADVNGVDGDRK